LSPGDWESDPPSPTFKHQALKRRPCSTQQGQERERRKAYQGTIADSINAARADPRIGSACNLSVLTCMPRIVGRRYPRLANIGQKCFELVKRLLSHRA